MRMRTTEDRSATEPSVRRACCPSCEENETRRYAVSSPIINARFFQSQGGRLVPSIVFFFEPRLGAELASVRIHDDSRAAKSADIISYPFNLFVESMSFPISTAHLVLPASPIAALKG